MTDSMLPAADLFVVVSPVLSTWSVHDPAIRTELTSSAFLTGEGWWFVDPSPIQDKTLEQLIGNDPVLGILLTNENHERAADDLRRRLHRPIHAHEAALPRLQIDGDYFFRDGNRLNGGLEIIHVPGATLGESCFYHAPTRVMLQGDSLVNLEETGFAFLPEKYRVDSTLMKKSLRHLLDYDFETLTFAHGPPIVERAKDCLKTLLGDL